MLRAREAGVQRTGRRAQEMDWSVGDGKHRTTGAQYRSIYAGNKQLPFKGVGKSLLRATH